MPKRSASLAATVYRSLFSAYPDALLLVDEAGSIVLANPAAAQLLGYAPSELEGLAVDALVPDSIRPRHAAYRQGYAQNPRPRPMGTQMELVARRKDGREVMVEIALSPLQGEGLPYVVAAIRDIGAYPRVKQALKRARYSEFVAEVGRMAVDTRDPQQLLQRIPQVAVEALEATAAWVYLLEADRLSFRLAGSAGVAAADGARLPHRADSLPGFVLAENGAVLVPELAAERRFAAPAGCPTRGSLLALPLSDRGQAIGVLSVHSAQSARFGDDELRCLQSLANLLGASLQRSQTEEALGHAQRLESVGQLTGGIAHDFNNLLTVIQGNLQVLEAHAALVAEPSAAPLVAAALRASRRGAELTGKLLAFSRRQLLQPGRVDTAQLLESLADMLRRTLDQRIRIELEIEAGCPALLADPVQLESALLNTAINARDAMPDGGLLRFAAKVCEQLPGGLAGELWPEPAGSFVRIDIGDSGCGMPEAVKERAFEPFFTTKEAGRGTGLGLSTVYGFVKQSRGAVLLDSSPGQGTTVSLLLPRYRSEPAADGAAQAPVGSLPAGLRVLLVEDEAEVRKLLLLFLEALGCTVQACATAEQALLELERPEDFELLLSDIALGPGMRGTELARLARERRPGLKVLLMSGFAAELPAPAAALLRKPFTREQLTAALAGLLG